MTLTVVMTPVRMFGLCPVSFRKRERPRFVGVCGNRRQSKTRQAGFAADGLHAKEPVHRGSFVRLICCYRPELIREAETCHLISLAERKPGLRIVNLYKP